MDNEDLRKLRRQIRWGLWAAIVLNFAIPFLLWSMLGHPPAGYGIGNFACAGVAIWADRWTQRQQRNGNGG